jgi:hypothetical protein
MSEDKPETPMGVSLTYIGHYVHCADQQDVFKAAFHAPGKSAAE